MYRFLKPKQRFDRQIYNIFEHKKHQWFKESDLVKIQEKKLKPLIKHAYDNVPFYHDLFDSVGIKPQNVKTIKDLQKIPILTKEVIRNNYPDKLVAKDVDITKCSIRSTTGSTGMPLKIAFSPQMEDYAKGLTYFAYSECGLRLKDKFVHIFHKSFHRGLLGRLFEKI